MTREAIISGLKFTVEMFLLDPSTGETITNPRNDMDKITIDACKGAIELLEQEPKTGHWIYGIDEGTGKKDLYAWTCSECEGKYPWQPKYCPNCGIKLESEGEEFVTVSKEDEE